jgi:NADH:ubiquinone oxidoreductase subunit C
MFGIYFTNHFDLRRILTDYGFLNFPLRKEFPLSGFTEIFYDDFQQTTVFERPEFAQEMRTLVLKSQVGF